MKLTKILGSPIAFHRCLAELSGSVTSGLMLSQAVYWTGKTGDPEGWFWKTQDEWFEETMLSRKEQESARRRLREITFEGDALWHEQLRGVPAKIYYRLDMGVLESLLAVGQHAQKGQSSMPVLGILESPKGANKNAQNGHTFLLAETTSENTSKKRSKSVAKAPSRNANYDCFAKAYEAKFNYPYQSKSSDFIQYNKWKKIDLERTDEALFEKAVSNYLASPQGKHTFADLVTRFAVFRNSALDRFGKPVESRNPPTPGSAAPLPPQGCVKCVQGWILPTKQGEYARKCECNN